MARGLIFETSEPHLLAENERPPESTPGSRLAEVAHWVATVFGRLVVRYPLWAAYIALAYGAFFLFSPERASPLAWGALALLLALPAVGFWLLVQALGWIFTVLFAVAVIGTRACRYVFLGR